jgi:hypothetical protein
MLSTESSTLLTDVPAGALALAVRLTVPLSDPPVGDVMLTVGGP